MQEIYGKRIQYIDILKAMACLCVLVGHVIGGIIKAGVSVSDVLRHIYTYVYLFHVPCFFFASGYLYANNPVKTGKEYLSLVIKKLVVLGVPYFVCTVFYVAMSAFFSNEMNPNTFYPIRAVMDIWKAPIAHYWYLYALIWLFISVPAVELIFRKTSRLYLWIAFFLLTFLGGSNIVCINYIVQYAYLFYLGVVWNKQDGRKQKAYFSQHVNLTWGGGILSRRGSALYDLLALYKGQAIICRCRSYIAECCNIAFGYGDDKGVVCNW